MIAAIDTFVLARVTSASHLVQRWCGATCYRQAVWMTLAWRVSVLCSIGDYWFPTLLIQRSRSMWTLFFDLLALLFSARFAQLCRRADETTGGETRPLVALMFSSRIDAVLRASMGLLLVSTWPSVLVGHLLEGRVVDMVFGCGIVAMWLAFYLVIVDPLPPGTSKICEFLTSIRAAFATPVSDGAGA